MILVYTGNGKGKTSACLGQVIRAKGNGMKVCFAQFMKRDGEAGEQAFLRQLLGDDFLAGGAGFFRREEDRPLHRQAALSTLDWARRRLAEADVMILDESLYALGHGLLTREELQALMEESGTCSTHLILSGRGFPEEFLDLADMVTEMKEIRHPWRKGTPALKGIDF